MEHKKSVTQRTYWHPAFYADIQIELKEDADNLNFENEHQLGTNPMEIDVLIIKKNTNRPIKKNIGKIFRQFNILEYKSPGDSLVVDDFHKVYGYTCFYKADAPLANSIPAEELTITFVTERYPRELIRHLKNVRKYHVTEVEDGIYYVKDDFFPIQIIETKKLSEKENLWLKNLTNNLKTTDSARKLMADYKNNSNNKLYRSVIETIMRANKVRFQEVSDMSDIFMEIVQEKFDRKLKEETDKAVEKAVEETVEKETEKRKEEVIKVRDETRLTEKISLIRKKCAKNKSLDVIADDLETNIEEIQSLYDAVVQNPGKTTEEIYQIVIVG